MRKISLSLSSTSLLAAAMLAISPAAAADESASQTIVIHAASLLRDADSMASGPVTITVANGKIASITDGTQPAPAGAKLIELPGHTLMPGLIDLHVHLTGNADESGDWRRAATDTEEWATASAIKNAGLDVRAGFTTVRDLGGSVSALLATRAAIDKGWFPGPRMVIAGLPLSTIGGHGDVHGFRPEVMKALDGGNICTGAVECAALVRQTVRGGADLIKIMATGGVLSQGDKSLGQAFTDEEMLSIAETAHSLGVKVAAHAHGDKGIAAATRAGIDTIEHGTFTSPATAKVMKADGTVLVPTLLAFKGIIELLGKGFYSPAVELKIREVESHVGEGCRNARAAGVTIAFGTDSAVTAHGRNAEEFGLLQDQCGMSPRDAIRAATLTAAKILDLDHQIGRIAPGYSADIVAVPANPLDDARILEKVDWVMVRGKVVD